jgi:ribonuclease Z
MLDCGALVSGKQPSHVFLTHTHNDHILFLTRLIWESSSPVKILLPASVKPLLEKYLQAWKELTNCDDAQAQATPLVYELIGVEAGTEFKLHYKGNEFMVKVIECDHRVTCYGYSVFLKKRQLKHEYRHSTRKGDVGQLKLQGIDPFEITVEPLFTFLGDTTHAVFQRYPEILNTSVLVVECSFLLDKDMKRAQETKHMHWNHLKPLVQSHPQTLFVLTHFSLKYTAYFIREFFQAYPNVHPMLVQSEVRFTSNRSNNMTKSLSCACFRCQPNEVASTKKRSYS